MQKSLSLLAERRKMGFTQAQLAEILGITAEYVSMIENGRKNPSKKILKKLDELIVQFNKSPSDSIGYRVATSYALRQASRDHAAAVCQNCVEKDARIIALERKLDQANESVNNLSRVLAQGRADAARSSGVGEGGA